MTVSKSVFSSFDLFSHSVACRIILIIANDRTIRIIALEFFTFVLDEFVASACNDKGDDSKGKHDDPNGQKEDAISANDTSVLDAFEAEAKCRDEKDGDGEDEEGEEYQLLAILDIVKIFILLELLEDILINHEEGENDHSNRGDHSQDGHQDNDVYGCFSIRATHCNFFVSVGLI